MKPAIPKATHEGEATLFGVKVRTYRLDSGESVIHADDFHKLIEAMFGDTDSLKTAMREGRK